MNEKIADVISRREFAFAPTADGSVFELVCSLGGNAASRRAVLSRAERLFGIVRFLSFLQLRNESLYSETTPSGMTTVSISQFEKACGGVDAVFFEHYVFDISSDWADTQVYLPPRAALDEGKR